ncbi:ABC transporter substrate-binding protein [Candidatus Microgenomates bacterium]|nr:ABC transporter substrate-binding protein [Candidatus Microgenomates bacterium]
MFFLPITSRQEGFSRLQVLTAVFVIAAIGAILFAFNLSNSFNITNPLKKTPPKRIAILTASDLQLTAVDGIYAGLAELGYKEGVNVIFNVQNPKGDRELTKKMATEIAASKPDLIVPVSTTATKAVQEAVKGTNIPVVFVDVGTVSELGILDLQRPTGNITGVGTDSTNVAGKRMEILKEIIPAAKTFGILVNPKHVSYEEIKKVHEEAADGLNITVRFYNLTSKEELMQVLQTIAKENPDGVMTTTESLLSANAETIAKALVQAKIPSIDFNEEKGVNAGYLVFYGAQRFDTGKQGARLISKVLKNESPNKIPVEFSTKLRLDINATLAKSMGVTIPQSILRRANKIL